MVRLIHLCWKTGVASVAALVVSIAPCEAQPAKPIDIGIYSIGGATQDQDSTLAIKLVPKGPPTTVGGTQSITPDSYAIKLEIKVDYNDLNNKPDDIPHAFQLVLRRNGDDSQTFSLRRKAQLPSGGWIYSGSENQELYVNASESALVEYSASLTSITKGQNELSSPYGFKITFPVFDPQQPVVLYAAATQPTNPPTLAHDFGVGELVGGQRKCVLMEKAGRSRLRFDLTGSFDLLDRGFQNNPSIWYDHSAQTLLFERGQLLFSAMRTGILEYESGPQPCSVFWTPPGSASTTTVFKTSAVIRSQFKGIQAVPLVAFVIWLSAGVSLGSVLIAMVRRRWPGAIECEPKEVFGAGYRLGSTLGIVVVGAEQAQFKLDLSQIGQYVPAGPILMTLVTLLWIGYALRGKRFQAWVTSMGRPAAGGGGV